MRTLTLLLLLLVSSRAFCQLNDEEKRQLDFLLGSWIGNGTGMPGNIKGGFIFKYDLDKNIIVRNAQSEIIVNGNPTSKHEDLLIIFKHSPSDPTAIYFDNEGHIINYQIMYTDSSVVFLSDTLRVIPGEPQFRLTYIKRGTKQLRVIFEYAMPDAPQTFIVYLDGLVNRKEE